MKRNIILICLISLLSCQAWAQQWEVVGSAGFSASGVVGGVCNWQNIRITDKGEIYISYNDEGFPNGKGTVMKFDGTTWNSVGTPGFTPDYAHHSSFALGGGDTIYFAFADGSSVGMSTGSVMMYDGTQWRNIGNNLTLGACQYSSILVTRTGKVYWSAIDLGTGQVVVKQYDGNSNWSNVGAINSGPAAYTFMELNHNDTLYIAYRDQTASPGMVRVKKFDGTNWVNVGNPFLSVTGGGASPAMDIAMAFGPNNEVYVAYSHGFQGPPRSSVQRFDGTNWIVVGAPQFAGAPGAPSLHNRLAIDKQGVPYLTFQNYGIGTRASVMKFDGTQWDYVGAQSVSDNVAAHTSIALDGNGNPHVLFFDEQHGKQNTVKRLSVCEAPAVPDITASGTDICIGDTVLLSATGDLNDATEWTWYSGSCNGAIVGTGNEVGVNPQETTIYYVRGLGGCVHVGECREVTVNVNLSGDLDVSVAVEGFTLSATKEYHAYQWIYNDESIPGATNRTYVVTQNGNYRVAVSNISGCLDTSENYPVNNVSVNRIGKENRDISIYPNPAKDRIFVDASFPVRVTLYSVEGRAIRSIENATGIPVHDLAQGMYLLHITDQDSILKKIEKVVVDFK